MSDSDLVKEVAKKLPQAAKVGHGGLKKPEMVEALFEAIFLALSSPKHAPKKSVCRERARNLANAWINAKRHVIQTNGNYFWVG